MSTAHLKFCIPGAPRTKKNSAQLVERAGAQRAGLFPSPAWRRWRSAVRKALKMRVSPRGDGTYEQVRGAPLVTTPVNCRAHFYRDRATGDAAGYYQGLADLLEDLGIVEDDALIVSWDYSRLHVDRDAPRVVFWLTPSRERTR